RRRRSSKAVNDFNARDITHSLGFSMHSTHERAAIARAFERLPNRRRSRSPMHALEIAHSSPFCLRSPMTMTERVMRSSRPRAGRLHVRGFTLLELMAALTVIGIL